jgi:hypothetical protein
MIEMRFVADERVGKGYEILSYVQRSEEAIRGVLLFSGLLRASMATLSAKQGDCSALSPT